jgi:hypothetical protein
MAPAPAHGLGHLRGRHVPPVVKINKQSAVKFINSIICRFEVLNRIITDNGPSLLVVPSKGIAKIWASRFITPLQLIQKAMDRWSVPMQKY